MAYGDISGITNPSYKPVTKTATAAPAKPNNSGYDVFGRPLPTTISSQQL